MHLIILHVQENVHNTKKNPLWSFLLIKLTNICVRDVCGFKNICIQDEASTSSEL